MHKVQKTLRIKPITGSETYALRKISGFRITTLQLLRFIKKVHKRYNIDFFYADNKHVFYKNRKNDELYIAIYDQESNELRLNRYTFFGKNVWIQYNVLVEKHL